MPRKKPAPKRLPRTGTNHRTHIHLSREQRVMIDRAARLGGVSRSLFIAVAAFAKATAVLDRSAMLKRVMAESEKHVK